MLKQWCSTHRAIVHEGTGDSQLYIFYHGYCSTPKEAYDSHPPEIISHLTPWTLIYPTTPTGRWWEYKTSSRSDKPIQNFNNLQQDIDDTALSSIPDPDTDLLINNMISTIKELLIDYKIILSGTSQGGALALHVGSYLTKYSNFRGVFSHNGYIDPALPIKRSTQKRINGYVTGVITYLSVDDHSDIFTTHSLRRSSRYNNMVKPFTLSSGSAQTFLEYLHNGTSPQTFIFCNSLHDQVIPFYKVSIPSILYI